MKKRLLTKREVGKVLSINTTQVDVLIDRGKLETVEIKPKVIGVKRESIDRYINKDTKKLLSLSRLFALLWLTAIIVFCLHLIIVVMFFDQNSPAPTWISLLLLSNVGVGILFFLGIFVSGDRKMAQIKWIPGPNILVLPFLYMLITSSTVFAGASFSPKKAVVNKVIAVPSPTATPTPTITTVSKSQINNSQAISSDTPVHCQIDANCGGGTRPLKKSECDKSVCCVIDGSYKLTLDSNQCDNAIIKCSIHPDCGGGYKEMKKVDCNNMTCCQTEGTWVLRSKGTCDQEQRADWYQFCNDLYPDRYTSQILMDGYNDCLKK